MTQQEPQTEGLAPPPDILVLTLTTSLRGRTDINYNLHPLDAVAILQEVVDNIEREQAEVIAAERQRRESEPR